MNPIYDRYKGKRIDALNDCFIDACTNGDLEAVKYLLTSEELVINAQINTQNNDGIFWATVNNHIDIVEYLLTSPDLEEKASISKNTFISACAEGKLELIQFFLTSPKIVKRPLFSELEDEALRYACKNNQFEVVKYFLTTKDLWKKANPDLAFRKAYEAGNLEMVKFLILDMNIQYSPYIRLYMGRNPNEQIEKWFELKELNQELKNDLEISKSYIKKVKI